MSSDDRRLHAEDGLTVRGANCPNQLAAQSALPFAYKRTELLLAGHSMVEVIAAIEAALDKKELPALKARTVCYMMLKSSYLTDHRDHNGPHLITSQGRCNLR